MIITLNIGNTHRSITPPQSWNELSTEQAMCILGIIQLGQGSLMDKRIKILHHLLGLRPEEIKAWQTTRNEEHGADGPLIFHAELQALLPITDFLFEKLDDDKFTLSPKLTKCPFPTLQLTANSSQLIALHSPADALANITGEELAHLFDEYEAYSKTQALEHLHRLVAILYRPSKPTTQANTEEAYHGDRRRPLNRATLTQRAQLVATLPVMVKNLILFWFLSCRMTCFVEKYSNVFKYRESEERQGNDYGWWGTFRAIAGSLKDIDAVAGLDAHSVLAELSYLEDRQRAEK